MSVYSAVVLQFLCMGGGGWSLVTKVMRGMDESRNQSDVEAVRASAEGYSLSFAALVSGIQSSVTENGVPTPTIGFVSMSLTGSSRLGTRSKCCVAQQDPTSRFSG